MEPTEAARAPEVRPDPESHYLKGEALYAQGRDADARREHEIAEREIGRAPTERMPKLWLARIYARSGDLAHADAIYESLWPPAPGVDAEVAVNHAEAHILNKDWAGGRRVLERLLVLDPKNLRGREVLAYVLEVTGDLDGELPVRAGLATDKPTASTWREQGRALERAGEYRAAYRSYETARAMSNGQADAALITSSARMRYRVTPEVAGRFVARRDPQAESLRGQAGVAVPLGSRHSLSFVGWHESSSGQVLRPDMLVMPGMTPNRALVSGGGTITGLGAGLLLASRRGLTLILGGDLRYGSTNHASIGQDPASQIRTTRVGGSAEVVLPFLGHGEVHVRGGLNEQWNDAAVTISEGGRLNGAAAQLYLFPTNRRILLVVGAQQRWLALTPEPTTPDPRSIQRLLVGGVDFVLWSRPTRLLRGEALDDKLARRSYLSDAAILSYRHQQLFGDSSFDFNSRLVLAPRAATHVGSGIVRLVLLEGRLGIDTRGALGYDTENNVTLYTGGASVVVTPSWSTRIAVGYDRTKETASGFGGTRQAGLVSFHVDI